MPLIESPTRPVPDFWNIYGHSWFQFQTGPSGDQTGRVDALFRSAMDIEYNNWRNFAFSGARVCANGRNLAGWTRVVAYRGLTSRSTASSPYGAPYAPDGGASVLCWGINDMGQYGGQNAACRNTIVDTLRAVISRCRASIVIEDSNAAFAYGAGWTNLASGADLCSGGTVRQCTTTTAATITFTIPSNYQGEIISFFFLRRPGTTGGTVTWSGTALSGHPDNATTFATGGGGQSSTEHSYHVKRFKGLTSANAGQTIIATTTALDVTTPALFFDCAVLESKTPPPVLVCDVAKAYTTGTSGSGTGYFNAFYNAWSSGRTEGQMDGDVDALNAGIYAMVQEFDGMVQVAYCDQALNPGGVKDPLKTSDGIHPNEYGAGAIVDALVDARNRLTPPSTAWGNTLSFNGPAPRSAALRRPRLVNYWHGPDYDQLTYSTYTPVAGHMFALPFNITEARDVYMNIGLEVTTAGTTQTTIRWALYDDVTQMGYPQQQIIGMDPTSGGAFSLTNSTGLKQSSNFNSGFGFVADPGLVWMVIKIETVGTSQVLRGMTGQSTYLPTRGTAGTGNALNAGWQLTGQSTGVLPSSFPTGATLGTTVPLLQMLRTK